MNAALLKAIITDARRGEAMACIIRALLEGGPRSMNVLEGICRKHDLQAPKKMLVAGMLVQKGAKRGTVYDLTPRCRAAAKQLPELNPAV